MEYTGSEQDNGDKAIMGTNKSTSSLELKDKVVKDSSLLKFTHPWRIHENEKYILYKDTSRTPDMGIITMESMANIDYAFRIFFKRHTCYDLVPTSSKLVVFDINLNVKKAFFALVYNGVRAALLWDSEQQRYVGMLTITDFIKILQQFYKSPDHPMEELEDNQIRTWRDLILDSARPLVSIAPEDTLLDAITVLLKTKVHRLPVIDTVSGNPLHILTHKRLLKYLYINFPQLPQPEFLEQRLSELGIGTFQDVCCVMSDCSLYRALGLFLERHVSALPVVDNENCLIDIYSKFDVINLAAARTYHNLDISVSEALEYRRGKFEGVATCQMEDTLKVIIERIVTAEVHRLVVVDSANQVIGIVSLSDILRFLTRI